MILFALAVFGILTVWIPARWPLAVLQCGVFALAIVRIRRPARSLLLIPLAAIVGWILLQIALGISVYPHDTWDALLVWTANLAIFFLAQQGGEAPRMAWPLFGAILAGAVMLQLFTSPGRIFWLFPVPSGVPPAGPFLSRNQYAALVEMLLPIAIVVAVTDRRQRAPGIVMAAVMYASVIAVASRAGAVLVTAEILLLLAQARHRRQISTGAAAATLAVLLLFTAAAGWDALTSRWNERAGFRIRAELLRSTARMIADRPLAGFGLGTWSTAYPAYARYDDGTFVNQAHNDWAQWTAEGGIPMLACLLWIAAGTIRPALRAQWPIGLVALLLHCLVDYPLQKPALEVVFFLLLGWSVAEPPGKPYPKSTYPKST